MVADVVRTAGGGEMGTPVNYEMNCILLFEKRHVFAIPTPC